MALRTPHVCLLLRTRSKARVRNASSVIEKRLISHYACTPNSNLHTGHLTANAPTWGIRRPMENG